VIRFGLDANANGFLDLADAILFGQEYIVTDSVKPGESININHSVLISSDVCRMIVFLDTATSCVCANNTLNIDFGFDFEIDTSTTCENLPIPFSICNSSSFDGARTYLWEDINSSGAEAYLSNVNILNPTFTSPPVTVQTIYEYSVRVNRVGACFNYDTLRVVVNPTPEIFTVTDTLLCPNVNYLVSPNTFEADIRYTVWDALTGGNNLGFSPFNTIMSVDTIFYLQAQDTLTGCILSPRIALNLYDDSILPLPLCKDTTVYLAGNFIIDSSYVNNGSTDNCGISTITLSQYNFNCSHIGVNPITLYVTDVNGNIDSCTANVTVVDTVRPAPLCKDTTIYLDVTGNYTIDSSYIENGSTDACGISTITLSKYTYSCNDLGINPVTLFVYDNSMNLDSCSANITVLDTTSPVVICQDITVYLDQTGQVSIVPSDIDNGSTDNCTITSTVLDILSFDCSDRGINVVTLTVTDPSGNSSSCTANVNVVDNIPPDVTCPSSQEVFLTDICSYTVTDFTILASAIDNCFGSDSVTLTQSPSIGSLIDYSATSDEINILPITITATDASNNSSSCVFDVEVSCAGGIFIPQAFSPNGDGENDMLYARGNKIEELLFIVYNRWGEKVFESINSDSGWDGNFRGSPAPSGVYVYHVKAYITDFGAYMNKGNITLTR
jgi:gliding motility-associated-like protein